MLQRQEQKMLSEGPFRVLDETPKENPPSIFAYPLSLSHSLPDFGLARSAGEAENLMRASNGVLDGRYKMARGHRRS